jgi:rhodanese-related sulfurtransferase
MTAERFLVALAVLGSFFAEVPAAADPGAGRFAGSAARLKVVDFRAGAVVDIDSAVLKRLRAKGVAIVDIRRPDEWKSTGVIAGSRLVALFLDERGTLNPRFMPTLVEIAPPHESVILVCRVGTRSAALAHALVRQMAYRRVYDLRDGIVGWIAAGNEIVAP